MGNKIFCYYYTQVQYHAKQKSNLNTNILNLNNNNNIFIQSLLSCYDHSIVYILEKMDNKICRYTHIEYLKVLQIKYNYLKTQLKNNEL